MRQINRERERKSFPFLIWSIQNPMKNLKKQIQNLVEAFCEQEEMTDVFVLEVRLEKGKNLKVFVDSDESLTFRKCTRISRHLEEKIEEGGWLPEKYLLEVSSPGADKPLVNIRQYAKHIGRTIVVETAIEKIEGELLSVGPDSIEIEFVTDKKKKLKEKVDVLFSKIVKANIIITINSKKK